MKEGKRMKGRCESMSTRTNEWANERGQQFIVKKCIVKKSSAFSVVVHAFFVLSTG